MTFPSDVPLTFGSLFAGVGGFDMGFERAGHECKWQVEIDEKCRQVLADKFPTAKQYEDVKEVGKHNLEPVDIICGGFPCQDLSVAGQRKGLDGNRSGLWFEFHRILDELRPGLCVIENVPGLLSSNKGRDFEIVLSGLVELGYCVAWRILDSRYFGVAQRRRRVFIVGSLGSGRSAQILFESESLRGDSEKGREARKTVAGTIKGGSGERGWSDPSDGNGGGLISMALKAGGSAKNEPDDETYIPVADTLAANGGA